MIGMSSKTGVAAAATAALGLVFGACAMLVPTPNAAAISAEPAPPTFEASCTAEFMTAAVSGLGTTVTIKPIKNGMFGGATRYAAASGAVPAYCQVSGSFVTNPATGKTANFMATFPAVWNGKYLQLGCSGHCGQFYVSNPAMPTITVTAQGYSTQIIEKGYATFATDEGHEGMDSASWAVKPDGSVDADFVDDFLFRATKVLSQMGKQFTTAFYGRVNGTAQTISRSYFNGCSGGGRDAMVAASYYPDSFDGIIAGSPYDSIGMTFQASAIGAAAARSPGAGLSPALLALFDKTVKAQCDGVDGVKDGLIQNPAACNFSPERDLPRCTAGASAGQCFTPAQIETASVIVSGITDERGNVVQPGYSLSELDVMPAAMAFLTDPTLKVFVHGNDPAFKPASIFSFRRGGPGPVTGFHAVVPSAEVARVRQAMALGAGHLPENTATLMRAKTKLLMWHNFSDEKLTPYSSVNWYKRLARQHGGYARVQDKARLFMLPGTTHCSIAAIAPNSFDALGAMEAWVEQGQAPDALLATVADRQLSPGLPKALALKTPNYTMPLCKFPAMARYSGTGDVQDAKNWSCNSSDRRLLQVGESGRQAGVSR
jgi:feruloyl esterase